ncbi:MAG TPA: response regulator [Candidatus Limnocylindria bacterium]|jgi:CheY-like chemotaxis protein
MRVLAVEDDPDTRHFYERFLREEGHEPIIARDGIEAMAVVEADVPPDLIMLDLGLPTIDGYELLRLLKTNPDTRDIPILIVSGRPLADGVELSGVVGVLRKPYDLPLLSSALRQAAAKCEARKP